MSANETRSWWAAAFAFASALIASSHHWLHVALVSLGFSFLAPVANPFLRGGMLAISVAATSAMLAWLFRSRSMPAARFWGLGAGACLSVALLAFTVVRDGF